MIVNGHHDFSGLPRSIQQRWPWDFYSVKTDLDGHALKNVIGLDATGTRRRIKVNRSPAVLITC